MEHDLSWLKTMIVTRAQEMWDQQNRPYYISYIAVDSAKQGVDYKELIKPLKLRQWVLTDDVDGLKVVEHPHHKAKIGFIPADAEYTFDDTVTLQQNDSDSAGRSSTDTTAAARTDRTGYLNTATKTRRATLHFLEALSKLDDRELDSINIPTRTIVRLLNG